ncbi:hypothetical protein K0A97_02285 [Patescibacteria group bacterium]|nr:hypothetical protein [Patescibacteria group bacterium]
MKNAVIKLAKKEIKKAFLYLILKNIITNADSIMITPISTKIRLTKFIKKEKIRFANGQVNKLIRMHMPRV